MWQVVEDGRGRHARSHKHHTAIGDAETRQAQVSRPSGVCHQWEGAVVVCKDGYGRYGAEHGLTIYGYSTWVSRVLLSREASPVSIRCILPEQCYMGWTFSAPAMEFRKAHSDHGQQM